MTVILDGAQMTDRSRTHEYLKEALSLPDYYGGNLDALYDLLTEYENECTIVLKNREAMQRGLGPYADALLGTLTDAVNDNPTLELVIQV